MPKPKPKPKPVRHDIDRLLEVEVGLLDSDPLTYRDQNGLAAFRWEAVAKKVAPGATA